MNEEERGRFVIREIGVNFVVVFVSFVFIVEIVREVLFGGFVMELMMLLEVKLILMFGLCVVVGFLFSGYSLWYLASCSLRTMI